MTRQPGVGGVCWGCLLIQSLHASVWCHRKGAMSRVYLDFAVGRRVILFVPAAACKQGIFKALLRGS